VQAFRCLTERQRAAYREVCRAKKRAELASKMAATIKPFWAKPQFPVDGEDGDAIAAGVAVWSTACGARAQEETAHQFCACARELRPNTPPVGSAVVGGAILVAGCLLSSRALAELPTDPVLARLIQESLARRPELKQAQATARAAREFVPQAGAFPDPMLQFGVQNDGFTSWEIGKMETSWYSIMASQTFPWLGKRRLRGEIAAYSAALAEQNVARIHLATEADVRRAYLDLMLARDRLDLLKRLEAISRRAAGVAQAVYEAGTGAQSDLLRAQLEITRIGQRRWALQADADTAVQALNRLRGHTLDEPIAPAAHIVDLPSPTLSPESLAIQGAFERSPEIASARASVAQGQQTAALARKSYFPDLTLSFGLMPRGGGFPLMWLATISGPVPVFAGSRQSRAVAEAEARLSANQSEAQAVEQVLRLRVMQRRKVLAALLETIRLYREGLLVQSEATAESTLAQYEVGKVTFIAVLDANAGFIADQDSYLQTLAQALRLQIEAAAVSLDPISSVGPTGSAMRVQAEPSGGAASGM
jgi:outer membrane protein TolC